MLAWRYEVKGGVSNADTETADLGDPSQLIDEE